MVLVADKDMEQTVKALLSRRQALNIKQITFDIHIHPQRDPGCFSRGEEFLRPFHNLYKYGLIIFDREGCGRENLSREDIEEDIENRLSSSGWGDRALGIAIDPELEIWVWSDSPEVDQVLGWGTRSPELRTWLQENNFLIDGQTKPASPKEAVERVLKLTKKPRSASLYFKLAERVGVNRCSDPAFLKLKTTLHNWFQ